MYALCDKYGWNPQEAMPFINLPFDIQIPFAINVPALVIVLILTLLLMLIGAVMIFIKKSIGIK